MVAAIADPDMVVVVAVVGEETGRGGKGAEQRKACCDIDESRTNAMGGGGSWAAGHSPLQRSLTAPVEPLQRNVPPTVAQRDWEVVDIESGRGEEEEMRMEMGEDGRAVEDGLQ